MDRRLVVSMAIVAVIAYSGCFKPGQYVANMMYGDLDLPIEREAAITATSFPPSPDIRAVIGGKGEGLDCSIPSLAEWLMFEGVSGAKGPVSLQFRQGCVVHDYCYRHGYATYGYTQADCDFMLLQAAFRTCIQIYDIGLLSKGGSAPGSNRPKMCETNAREVLLGVRMGGWGSFKAREDSSYFEFDPLPLHANNYSIARLARVSQDKATHIDGEPLLSTLMTFHFSSGQVKIRQTWSPKTNQPGEGGSDGMSERIFPDNALPTPPYVIRATDKDWLVWLTRKSNSDTGFATRVDIPVPAGESFFRKLPCPYQAPVGGKPVSCDFDSSVVRVIQPLDSSQEKVGFYAFTHRFADKTVVKGKYEKATIGLHRWEMPLAKGTEMPSTIPEKLTNVSGYKWRFLQSELHVGEFRKSGCNEIVTLGRGIYLNSEGRVEGEEEKRSGVAKGYETMAAAGFIPLSVDNCPRAKLYPVLLPQEAEPAVPISKGLGESDRLMTLSAGSEGDPVQITEYSFGDADRGTYRMELPKDKIRVLDATWVKSAAYVVRSGVKGDRLFFSRVVLDKDDAKKFKEEEGDNAPDNVRIEFRYFVASETNENKWVEQGYSSCKIDLNEQHEVKPKDSRMYALLWRFAFEGPGDLKEKESLFKVLHKREMVRQWMQSQVIPGYIFDGKKPEGDRPIDVVVVFHDSPESSLLLQGMRAGTGELDYLKVRMPSEEFSFASCSRSTSKQS